MKNYFGGIALTLLAVSAAPAQAGFVNGSFEAGDFSGWTEGSGYRGGSLNPLDPSDYLPGGADFDSNLLGRSQVIDSSYVDPNVGALLGSTVYGGGRAARIEDTVYGGYASVVSQTVTNYTDSTIFFAWKAVLENGNHSDEQSAIFQLVLTDLTTGLDVISRSYNAGDGGTGVDPRFDTDSAFYYTPKWQIEALTIDSALSGHDFRLVVLAADCQPTGHTGYAYLDGFGAAIPDPDPVPEPATFGLMGLGLLGLAFARRRGSKA